ncbi:hypothetical protein NFI95_15740, partial [Acetobacteraceae bacterium KSS8]|nr:hypothetical protein [Acetobacteraceae bacterium KSS8]
PARFASDNMEMLLAAALAGAGIVYVRVRSTHSRELVAGCRNCGKRLGWSSWRVRNWHLLDIASAYQTLPPAFAHREDRSCGHTASSL